ncbi:hypothetical protein [Thalassomonas actiniarum]|uniref:Uncharacterized protein n=1 Tax=Thalassomonas actiniarum TaxID=485447 RepID=A0AAE9YSH5_9GAMM|nr:hypothetical protein [Thalassomonas actiniarum]WDE00416.1 hypothetical protein SG35_007185 [Thalassomonas actiniarum]
MMNYNYLADTYLEKEQNEIKDLLSSMDSFQTRALTVYSQPFPLTCPACGQTYQDIFAYYKVIKAKKSELVTSTKTGSVFEQKFHCLCSEYLFETSFDYRDTSEQGQKLRDLFDLCLAKVNQLNLADVSREEIFTCMQALFSFYINLYAYFRNEIPFDFLDLIEPS